MSESNAAVHVPPARKNYDVVIIGGAMMGSSLAWFLASNDAFDGSILVVERDPTYEFSSTYRSAAGIRQQFSSELNVRISQFGAQFIDNLRSFLGDDPRVPEVPIRNIGYMYLAGDEAGVERLKYAHGVQQKAGAATRLMRPEEIAEAYPFYNLDGVLLGSHNTVGEGTWDPVTVHDWWKRIARERGAEFIHNEAVALDLSQDGTRVDAVHLASSESVACGTVINAAGTRAASVAGMAGITIPVEPRKRFAYVFKAEQPLSKPLPLTIDTSGVYCRQDGSDTYLAGGHTEPDGPSAIDDFSMDHGLWMDRIWPAIATRIPQFEAVRVIAEWCGHYAYNMLDQNAIAGPHPHVRNFIFMNGFSGHGVQQSPAMGRGMAELIVHGEYRSLDLSPFHFDRVLSGTPYPESAII